MKLFAPPSLQGRHLSETLASDWLTTGPQCGLFQEEVAATFPETRSDQIVLGSSVTTCFEAILGLIAIRNNRHRKIYIADATWPGMHQAIWNMPGLVRVSMPSEADIVVLTDIGGRRLCEEDERHLYTGKPVNWLIHDASHSWVPKPNADFALMSCYPTKLLAGAEGGVVRCYSPNDARDLRRFLYNGLEPGRAGQGDIPSLQGRKGNMTDVTAALNREALENMPAYLRHIRGAWHVMAQMAEEAGVPYRKQPERPYLFQIEVPRGPFDSGTDMRLGEIMHTLGKKSIPSARNFRPSGLLTVPFDVPDDCRLEILDQVKKALERTR